MPDVPEVPQEEPNTKKPKKSERDPDHVLLTQKELNQIKEDLTQMIQAMAHNPSLLSRAASYWGTLLLWQKIIVGIVLIVPTLVISIATQTAVIAALSLFTLFTYTASSLLLDNHHQLNTERTEHLSAGINRLAGALGLIILSLDKIREQLAAEIEQFQQENELLSLNVDELHAQIQELTQQNKLLKGTEQALSQTNKGLKNLNESLQGTTKKHEELLEITKEQLKQVQLNYSKAQGDLNQKIAEFHQLKLETSEEIKRLHRAASTLDEAIQILSDSLLLDKTQKQAFREKLESFLNDKQAKFEQITQRICRTGDQLALIKEEFECLNKQHQPLLQRGAEQMSRLEKLQLIPPQSQKTTASSSATTMKKIGIYASEHPAPVEKDGQKNCLTLQP